MCSRAFGICLLLWMDIHNVSKPAKHKTQTRTRTYRRSTKRPDQTTQPRNPTSADSVRLGGGLHDQQTTPGWPHAARPQTGSGGSCDSREPFSFLKLPRAIKGLIDWGKGGGAKINTNQEPVFRCLFGRLWIIVLPNAERLVTFANLYQSDYSFNGRSIHRTHAVSPK